MSRSSTGWYYKQDNQTCGPVSTEQLQELLTLGTLQPRQAVWKQGEERLFFVHAVTAASGSGHGFTAGSVRTVTA
jgi:hypothetical protein